jgi:ATP-dependent RNA helicase RhlE
VPEDYIHRVGRTARAELKGSAYSLVCPEEEGNLRDIEKAIGNRLPRVTLPDFDYAGRPPANLDHRPPRQPHGRPRGQSGHSSHAGHSSHPGRSAHPGRSSHPGHSSHPGRRSWSGPGRRQS